MRAYLLLAAATSLVAQQLSPFEVHLASGRAAIQQSRYSEGERQLRLAMADQDAGPRLAEALEALCDLDLLVGRYEEAIDLQQRAVDSIHSEEGLAPHLIRLAAALRAGGKTPAAVPVLIRALSLDTRAFGEDSEKAATGSDALASAYAELRDFAKARGIWQRSLEARIRRLGEDHADVSTNYLNLALIEEKDEKPLVARRDYEKALAISEKRLGVESYALTGILDRLGLLLRGIKNFGEAEPVLQRSLAIREKTLGARHSEVAPALDNLALTYFYDRKFAEAEPLYTRSLQIWLATQGPYSPLVAQALDNLGALFSAQQKYQEAEPFFKRALSIRERQDIESLWNLATLHAAKKENKLADAFYQRAILIGENGLGGDHFEVTDVMDEYAKFLRVNGRLPEAKKLELHSKDLRDHPHKEEAAPAK